MNTNGREFWRSIAQRSPRATLMSLAITAATLGWTLPVSAQNSDPADEVDGFSSWVDGPQDPLPQVVQSGFDLPPLLAASIATDEIGNGRTPEGFRSESQRPLQVLPESASDRGTTWNWAVTNWAAPNTFSYPRYFEDRMLERHGHQRGHWLQPAASGARFFATVPMLPYLMTLREPCECEYTLGYYRTGTCAPVMLQRPPWERRAAVAEAVSVGTAIAVIP